VKITQLGILGFLAVSGICVLSITSNLPTLCSAAGLVDPKVFTTAEMVMDRYQAFPAGTKLSELTPPQEISDGKPDPEIDRSRSVHKSFNSIIFELLIGEEGNVLAVRTLAPIDPYLAAWQFEAAAHRRFKPAIFRDEPVRMWMAYKTIVGGGGGGGFIVDSGS